MRKNQSGEKIKETVGELKEMLRREKEVKKRERIEVLWLLKTGQAASMIKVAEQIGRGYWTVKKWMREYRKGGVEKMTEVGHGGGRKLSIPKEVLEQLEERLKQREGFSSYKAIQSWIKEAYGLEINYKTLHKTVHNRLEASPKIVRPQSAKQDELEVNDFKKKSVTVKHHVHFI